MENKPKVGEIWISEYNYRHIFITEVEPRIIHFYFIDNPEAANSRNEKIFHGVFRKYKGIDDEMYV